MSENDESLCPSLNIDSKITHFEKESKESFIKFLGVCHEINVKKFFTTDFADMIPIDFVELDNEILKTPMKIHTVFSSLASGIVLEWLSIILKHPEEFAHIVVKYFQKDNSHLSSFAAISFPAMFHNFYTEEFQQLAYSFLSSILDIGDIGTFWYFCLAFLESSSLFSRVLWENFESLEIQSLSNNFNNANIFFNFLECLKKASLSLSIYQHKIIKKFNEANRPTCSLFICKYLIEKSLFLFDANPNSIFNEPSKKESYVKNQIFQILEYSTQNPNSPHYSSIINILSISECSIYLAPIQLSHVYLVLSPHDCYLIQDIIKESSKSMSNDSIKAPKDEMNGMKFIQMYPLKKNYIDNYSPISIELSAISLELHLLHKEHSMDINVPFFCDTFFGQNSFKDIKKRSLERLINLLCFQKYIENEFIKLTSDKIKYTFTFMNKLHQKKFFDSKYKQYSPRTNFVPDTRFANTDNIVKHVKISHPARSKPIKKEKTSPDLNIMLKGNKKNGLPKRSPENHSRHKGIKSFSSESKIVMMTGKTRKLSLQKSTITLNLSSKVQDEDMLFSNSQQFKNEVNSILTSIYNLESKMFFYFVKINSIDFERNNSNSFRIINQYKKIINIKRVYKFSKYLKKNPNWNIVAQKVAFEIDKLREMKIGTSILFIFKIGELLYKISNMRFFENHKNKFILFALMNSKTDCIMKYYFYAKKVLYSFKDLRILVKQQLGNGFEHLDKLMKKSLLCLDENLVTEIEKESKISIL